MMGQEVVEIDIFYFQKERLLDKLESFKSGISDISPDLHLLDLPWDYFFVSKKEKHKVLEVLEYENGLKFLVLENDIIWYESIPGFKDGEFYWISQDSRLFSLRSIRERSDLLYKKLFNIEKKGFDSFSEFYKILDRNDKLKKLGI
jgi:hypothetical protein